MAVRRETQKRQWEKGLTYNKCQFGYSMQSFLSCIVGHLCGIRSEKLKNLELLIRRKRKYIFQSWLKEKSARLPFIEGRGGEKIRNELEQEKLKPCILWQVWWASDRPGHRQGGERGERSTFPSLSTLYFVILFTSTYSWLFCTNLTEYVYKIMRLKECFVE